jgi:16S rRNA (uracil1498-N3)-methyltransferase
MSESRVWLDASLETGARVELPEGPFRHLVQVLRMQAGETLVVFNGQGGEYEAVLETVAKRSATLRVGTFREVDRESPLQLTLVQGISKGDRMDFTIQKAVELGVSAIVPVLTERCNVNLDRERQEKKLEHWRGIIVSACEQSGRTRLPVLEPIRKLADWLGTPNPHPRLALDPLAADSLSAVDLPGGACSVIVGPEGGLSEGELATLGRAGCRGVRLGPRVLRTETAGAAVLAVLQAQAGDFRAK